MFICQHSRAARDPIEYSVIYFCIIRTDKAGGASLLGEIDDLGEREREMEGGDRRGESEGETCGLWHAVKVSGGWMLWSGETG